MSVHKTTAGVKSARCARTQTEGLCAMVPADVRWATAKTSMVGVRCRLWCNVMWGVWCLTPIRQTPKISAGVSTIATPRWAPRATSVAIKVTQLFRKVRSSACQRVRGLVLRGKGGAANQRPVMISSSETVTTMLLVRHDRHAQARQALSAPTCVTLASGTLSPRQQRTRDSPTQELQHAVPVVNSRMIGASAHSYAVIVLPVVQAIAFLAAQDAAVTRPLEHIA